MIGTTVSHYRITARLGQGGMGEVYVAFDEALARKVALKAIRPDRRLSGSARARFLREARVLSQLDHPATARAGAPPRRRGGRRLGRAGAVGSSLSR